MAKQHRSSKLAVILHADIAGSTQLVHQDEQLAHKRIQESFQRFSGIITRYHGQVRELRGDALLAVFERASEAVNASLAFQKEQASFIRGLDDEIQPTVRVGIAMGEVVIADNTITGAGVVLSQRLEQLAEPGKVIIQSAVRDTIPNRYPFAYSDLGALNVKGFDHPVKAFGVELQEDASIPTPDRADDRLRNAVIALVSIAVIAGGAAILWMKPWQLRVEPASIERMAFPLPDKPSIAVLPFTNMSNDTAQDYFSDGITEDLITDLSKLSGLFVISRNTMFTFKNKPLQTAQIAEELGVRYVLEGSVRRENDRVRINAQLIDATTGGHLWAERYDGTPSDVFALQDKVVSEIAVSLSVELTDTQIDSISQPQTENLEAYDALLKGWTSYQRNTPDELAKAVKQIEKAIALDPEYTRAHAALAAVYQSVFNKNWFSGTSTWNQRLGISTEVVLHKEREFLEKAMENPDPSSYRVLSHRQSWNGEHEKAISSAQSAIELNPNDPIGYEALTIALIFSGLPSEAIPPIEKAMRLNPRYPSEYIFWLGLAQFIAMEYELAVDTLVRATQDNPDNDVAHIVLAAAYGQLGQIESAKRTIDEANTLRNERQGKLIDWGLEPGIEFLLPGPFTLEDVNLWPFKNSEDRERLKYGLQLAGVPEQSEESVSPMYIMGVDTIDAVKAKELFDRGVKFIDVRGVDSWLNGHIPKSVNLPINDSSFSEESLSGIVGKQEAFVVYCMGPRCLISSTACQQAVKWGYEQVHYFRDGFPSWKASGYPVAVP